MLVICARASFMAVRQPRLRHAMRAQLRTPRVSKSAVSSSVRPSMLASALGAATALEDDAAAALARRRGGIGAVAFTLREAGVKNKDRLNII